MFHNCSTNSPSWMSLMWPKHHLLGRFWGKSDHMVISTTPDVGGTFMWVQVLFRVEKVTDISWICQLTIAHKVKSCSTQTQNRFIYHQAIYHLGRACQSLFLVEFPYKQCFTVGFTWFQYLLSDTLLCNRCQWVPRYVLCVVFSSLSLAYTLIIRVGSIPTSILTSGVPHLPAYFSYSWQ